MPNPTTPNLVLEQPLRGAEVGTWDVPVNGNTGIIDTAFGGVTTLALSSANITLAASQAQASVLRFTGTLTANVTITLPSIYKGWTMDDTTTGSFLITLISTSGASIIGVPPSEATDIFYDGTNIKFRNLGRVGTYVDLAFSVIPTWVTACTVPPYLNCTGTTFSSATYPLLAGLLGGNILPDAKGRSRATLNQGSSRITSSGSGINGNVILGTGGAETVTLLTSQIPSHTHANTLTDPGHTHPYVGYDGGAVNAGGGVGGSPSANVTSASFTGMSINNAAAGGSGAHSNMGPTYMGGITMIRAG